MTQIALHVDQSRDESRLGASEAPAVLGLDRYSSPMTIWRRHRGMPLPDRPTEAAEWGVILEPVVRGRYAIDRQRTIFVPQRSFQFEDWLRATPDGIFADAPDDQPFVEPLPDWFDIRQPGVGLLQVKTCSAYLGDDWAGGPPPRHEAQCRVEMAVVDLPWVDILCLVGGQKLVGPFRIERDAAIERSILTRLRDFWAMVQDGREPTVDDSEAWRLHVSEKLGKAPPLEVVATEAQRELVRRWRAARVARKAAERGEESVKNELLLNLAQTGATKLDAGDLGKPSAYRTKTGTWALRTPSFWREDNE